MTDIWRLDVKKTLPNGERGLLEVATAVHHKSAGKDHVILRELDVTGDPIGEAWISIDTLDEVLSAAKAAGTPRQREFALDT